MILAYRRSSLKNSGSKTLLLVDFLSLSLKVIFSSESGISKTGLHDLASFSSMNSLHTGQLLARRADL